MSIFGKKSGANPVDGSEVLLSEDFTDSGEELTEIEKTRRDLMVARLESFKREAAEQAAAESSKPIPIAAEPQPVKLVPVPQRPLESARPRTACCPDPRARASTPQTRPCQAQGRGRERERRLPRR